MFRACSSSEGSILALKLARAVAPSMISTCTGVLKLEAAQLLDGRAHLPDESLRLGGGQARGVLARRRRGCRQGGRHAEENGEDGAVWVTIVGMRRLHHRFTAPRGYDGRASLNARTQKRKGEGKPPLPSIARCPSVDRTACALTQVSLRVRA